MKQTNKLSLASIKIKSFATTLTTIESSFIKGGSYNDECNPRSENIACNTGLSGHPQCLRNNEDPN